MASGLQGKAELDSVSLLVAVVLMWLGGGSATDMDIDRPDLKRRRRRQRWALAVLGLLSLAGVTLGLSRLQPAAPRVDRAQVWTDSVRRGDMLRQVRGNGSLVPEQIQYVQADTEGRIERILVLPGAAVEPETILMELSNPELEQEAFDLEWQLKAAQAGLKNIEVRLESERLAQESVVATLKAEWHNLASQAKLYYMPKSFLMRIIESLAEEELDELARDTAKNDIVDVSLFLRGSFTLTSLSDLTETWLRISRIPHRFESYEDHDRIIIEHDMGFKYSYFIKQIARYVLEVALEAKMSCDTTDNTVVLKLYQ
jgi:hypothetical protein